MKEYQHVTYTDLLQSVWMVFLDGLCLEYVGIFSLAKNDGTVGP